jgi:hypothetical protein
MGIEIDTGQSQRKRSGKKTMKHDGRSCLSEAGYPADALTIDGFSPTFR